MCSGIFLFFCAFHLTKICRSTFLIATSILDNFHFNTSDYLSQFSLHKCNLITLSWVLWLWMCCCLFFNVEHSAVHFENLRFIRKLHIGEAKKDMWVPIPQGIIKYFFSAKIMPLNLAITQVHGHYFLFENIVFLSATCITLRSQVKFKLYFKPARH